MMTSEKKGPGRPRKAAAERAETFSIRVVPGLRQRLEDAASQSGRSLNAEIVDRLERSLDSHLTYQLIERRIDEHDRLLSVLAELSTRKDMATMEMERHLSKGGDARAVQEMFSETDAVIDRELRRIEGHIQRSEAELLALLRDFEAYVMDRIAGFKQ